MIGCIHTSNPRQRKCYFLCLLLNEEPGPTSCDAMKTVNDQVWCARPTEKHILLESYWRMITTSCYGRGQCHQVSYQPQVSPGGGPNYMHSQQSRRTVAAVQKCCPIDLPPPTRCNISNQEAIYNDKVYNQVPLSLEDKVAIMGGKPLASSWPTHTRARQRGEAGQGGPQGDGL